MSDDRESFADLIVVKVHAQGLLWWLDQGMPDTLTIGCTTLREAKGWRTYAQPRTGAHYVYRPAPGLVWPSVEYDTFIDTHEYRSRIPPDPTKFWIDRREPAVIEWFPDPEPLKKLALDLTRNLLASQ